MSIPYNIRPEYTTTIPSNGKKIRYVPFSIKEEKILILASESGDKEEILNSILNTIQRCIVHPSDIDVRELALFDIEFLFLKERSKSIGEKITVQVTDPNDSEYSVEHEINIDKIGVEKSPEHKDIIEISKEISVKLNYPGIDFFMDGIDMSKITTGIEVLSKCLSQIINGEEVVNRVDMTQEEIEKWFDSLTNEQYIKLSKFITTMPKLKYSFTLKNRRQDSPQFGKDFTIVLEGLADFF